jgi:putative N-acetylmannosamine-6-phosphate epimerase
MIAACHLKVAAAEEIAAVAAAIDLHIIGSVKRRGNSAELALACLHQLESVFPFALCQVV